MHAVDYAVSLCGLEEGVNPNPEASNPEPATEMHPGPNPETLTPRAAQSAAAKEVKVSKEVRAAGF